MESAHKPYDGFFRSVFARPRLAWELTRTVAPALASGFTARQVHVESESPVDPEFARHHTDLLIRLTRRKTDTFVLVLYEHKSTPDRYVALQLLSYLSAIWQRSHRKHRRYRLPRVIPIVIYHGRSSWKPPEFSELVEGPGGEDVPRFVPRFVNLADVPPEEISGSLGFVVSLLALKYVRQKLTNAIAERLAGALEAALADPQARELAEKAEMLYGRTRSPEDIRLIETAARKRGYHRAEEGIMTFAEAKIQEGLQRGREEGRQEGELLGKRAALVRQLSRKFTVTDPERERILSCDDSDALDAALDEIVTADDKASVLSKLS
jgi:predicted transposase/invertase (TIGR01784 family)